MPTDYPTGFDDFDAPGAQLDGPPAHSDMHINIQDAVEAIQAELGLSPKGDAVSVAARLAALSGADVQMFTASGTWTKPDGANLVMAIAIGSGASGASGDRRAAGTDRRGGGGGGGGERVVAVLPASLVGATEVVTVGGATAGPAGVSADSTVGTAGNDGSPSTFGFFATANGGFGAINSDFSHAYGGHSGQPTLVDTYNGTGTSSGHTRSGRGGDGGGYVLTTGGTAVPSGGNLNKDGGGSGGAGGGSITAANSAQNGGSGGGQFQTRTGGGAAGVAPGGDGGNGNPVTPNNPVGGASGGGGGAHAAGAGGAGGNGGLYGGGGGGGGASVNGSLSGAGGTGAAGIVAVFTWT